MSTLSLNEVRLAGNIGNDIELKELANKSVYCQFNLATTVERKNSDGSVLESVEWHRCVAFGDVAKHIESTCQKGTNVYLTGKLQSRFFKNTQGVKQERTEVVIRAYQALSGAKEKQVDIDAILEERAELDDEKERSLKDGSSIPF